MARLPEHIERHGLLVRRWRVEDAELLAEWTRDWEGGGDVYLAVLREGRVAGRTASGR